MFFGTVLYVSAPSAGEEFAISDLSAVGTLQIVVHLVSINKKSVLVKCANVTFAVAKSGAKRRCIIVVRSKQLARVQGRRKLACELQLNIDYSANSLHHTRIK